MRIFRKLTFSAIIILAAAGQARSEDSIRGQLLDSGVPSAVYSVDDYTTLFRTGAGENVGAMLEKLCSGHNGAFKAEENAFACTGIFEASRVESDLTEEQAFFLKTTEPQPLAYMNPSIPSIEKLAPLPSGKIAGDHSSVDMYQYVYALCKKENGTPSVVISKRSGKIARYTEVGAAEAFSYFMTSGDRKDPWFFACEGEKRFLVEKDYQFAPDGPNKFYFHPKRGLEWVEYVKAESSLAKLEKTLN